MLAKPQSAATVADGKNAEGSLQEAQARMKSATDRHAAVVDALSRLGASAQDRRLAQAQSKKVDQELRDARRALEEAEAATRKA